jgi:hypothetical protein
MEAGTQVYIQHDFPPRKCLGMIWIGGVVVPRAEFYFVWERKFLASIGTQTWVEVSVLDGGKYPGVRSTRFSTEKVFRDDLDWWRISSQSRILLRMGKEILSVYRDSNMGLQLENAVIITSRFNLQTIHKRDRNDKKLKNARPCFRFRCYNALNQGFISAMFLVKLHTENAVKSSFQYGSFDLDVLCFPVKVRSSAMV